jgi:dihydrofolate synthase/folylpolyglutamate synthase
LDVLPSAFHVTPEIRAEAFARARLAGRLDRRGEWLFDVAHNLDGMRALTAALDEFAPPGPIHALVSILGDKEWPAMLVELDRVIDVGILTVAPSADTRRWDLGWLERWLADPSRPSPRASWRLIPEFDVALEEVRREAGTVLVTGSFHTVGDVMQAIGIDPLH